MPPNELVTLKQLCSKGVLPPQDKIENVSMRPQQIPGLPLWKKPKVKLHFLGGSFLSVLLYFVSNNFLSVNAYHTDNIL